jgi:hypothetical protein
MELGALGCIFVRDLCNTCPPPLLSFSDGNAAHLASFHRFVLFSLFLSFFFYYTVLILGLTATVHAGRPGLWLLGVPSNSFRVNKVWKLTSPKLS